MRRDLDLMLEHLTEFPELSRHSVFRLGGPRKAIGPVPGFDASRLGLVHGSPLALK